DDEIVHQLAAAPEITGRRQLGEIWSRLRQSGQNAPIVLFCLVETHEAPSLSRHHDSLQQPCLKGRAKALCRRDPARLAGFLQGGDVRHTEFSMKLPDLFDSQPRNTQEFE